MSTGQDRLDKERDVWEAFKDEHIEVFELSSTLLRRYKLVRVLDHQHSQNTASLQRLFLQYVQLRKTDAPQDTHSTRNLLSMISKLLDASVRDAGEKRNLCKTSCDSVDRCIRIIDQAIQEQQHAISLPGSHLPPILLPDIAAPRKLPPAILDDFLDAPPPKPIIRRKKSKKGRKTDTGADNVPSVRPTPPLIPNPDPNEPRYCYCDQISHGEMIACDDKKCEREWFHLVCTGLETAPEGPKKWYCDDCIERRKRRK